jgi:hypothetical protein
MLAWSTIDTTVAIVWLLIILKFKNNLLPRKNLIAKLKKPRLKRPDYINNADWFSNAFAIWATVNRLISLN